MPWGGAIRIGSTFFRFLRHGMAAGDQPHPVQTRGIVAGPAFDEILSLLDQAAASNLCVLITGETGTGKELAARHLHEKGGRREGPLVPVNCAAIPTEIVESELFGHVKGAFTGAAADSPGLLRQATGGTLFLDEIGELSLASQAKLLRVLQDHRVQPVGGTRPVDVDIRVVCATNQDLAACVQQRRFRLDLYARIAELTVRLPPLKERIEDVPLLVQHFVDKHAEGRYSATVGALEQLCCRPWPLNIRELESAVRRAILLAGSGPLLEATHFAEVEAPAPDQAMPGPAPAAEQDPEVDRLSDALRRHDGDVLKAAAELGISQSQLYRRARKLGIRVGRFRS